MNTDYKVSYIAVENGECLRVWVSLDLTPFLEDGISRCHAEEAAMEIFERHSNNFKSW